MVATTISELVMKLVGHSEMAASDVAGLASLHAWLGQELETRGIDAVIYTRYILSILQQDAFIGEDLDSTTENQFFPPNRRDTMRAKPVRAGRKSDKRRPVSIEDCDQQKKNAAVECLLSLSDEECGIESLVDELFMKLKEQQANIPSADVSTSRTGQSDTTGSSDSDSSEPSKDPAQRYYAAFPALTTEAQPAASTLVPLPPEGGIWAAKVTQGLARRDRSTEILGHSSSTKQMSPFALGANTNVQVENERRRRCYMTVSDWQCRCCGRQEVEKAHRQRPRRCSNCDSWNIDPPRFIDKTSREKYSSQHGEKEAELKKEDKEVHLSLSPYGKLPPRNTKAWKEFEYMRPIFIVPKVHSPDLSSSRVRSVRTNQKTESVLDFFFKTRAALASPLCYCGAESIWGCTDGCLNWPEMLGLGANSEDQSWYTEPLDMMVKPSSIQSRRLYNRMSVFNSFSNITFFENHIHTLTEALLDEEQESLEGLDPFGLSSLLNRTLEESAQELEDNTSETDSFNTAEESISEAVSEMDENGKNSGEILQGVSNEKEQSDDILEKENNKEISFNDIDEIEEVAYPSHIKPPIKLSVEEIERQALLNETPEAQLNEASSAPMSPESHQHWSVPETFMPSTNRSTPYSPDQSSHIKAVWDLHPALKTGLSESPLDSFGQNAGTIWGCTSLSPHLLKQNEDLLNVACDSRWGFSSSSGSNSKSASHASSQDNLYEASSEHVLVSDQCSCGQPIDSLSGALGLGSGVWTASADLVCGRMPTPRSNENEVLDDRPLFYLPLGDEDCKNSLEDPDSPLPIPPLEFNFSDSDDDLATPSPTSSCHPNYHPSPTQTHHHHLSPSSVYTHQSHSCICSTDHVDKWNGQAEENIKVAQSHKSESCDCTGRGVMAALTCDTLESDVPNLSQDALPNVLLTTSFPDSSSVWSYCLGSLRSPAAASDHSLFVNPLSEEWPTSEFFYTLPLSPKHEGSCLSHLWDVNAVHRCNICEWDSDKLAVGIETQNIRRYLMNIGFKVPNQECRIIESGLRGSLLNSPWAAGDSLSPDSPVWNFDSPPLQTWENHPALPTMEEECLKQDQFGQNFERRPKFFRQRSTSADHTDNNELIFSRSMLSGSTSLLPSKNSAFSDRIPPKVTHLPHVQSEPALVKQNMPHGRVYNHGRLVQVRSLYKSDVSILHQLGLTCGHEEDPQMGVQVLPHTHFVPIGNDPTMDQSTATSINTCPARKVDADQLERIPTPTGPVPEVCPVLGRQSNYQLYQHPEDDLVSEMCNFVPRFQVQKATEKCCQTGEKTTSPAPVDTTERTPLPLEDSPEPECACRTVPEKVEVHNQVEHEKQLVSESGDGQQEALGMFLYDMQDVLELSVEDAERFMSNVDTPPFPHVEDDKDEVDYSSDYESMGAEQVAMEELGKTGIAELWEGGEVNAAACPSSDTPVPVVDNILASGSGVGTVSTGSAAAGGHYRSIWSWGNEGDLPSLPKKFSTSSQDVGDGIPCGQVPWSLGDCDVSLSELHLEDTSLNSADIENADISRGSGLFSMDPLWLDDSDDVFIDDPEVQMQLAGVDPNPEPDQVIFSSDLEYHWLSTDTSFTVQVPNPGQLKHSGQRKPCSFFLEGNCRRTDCKFAHDISNITCRFWEEQNCFKGVTCPFLHGYPGKPRIEETVHSNINRDFSLENEEFPELGTTQDDKTGKESNLPKKRGGQKKSDERIRPSLVDSRRRRYKGGTTGNSPATRHVVAKSTSKDCLEKETHLLCTEV